MLINANKKWISALISSALFLGAVANAQAANTQMAATAMQNSKTPVAAEQVAVFAGGCFWGIEAVFEHVKGVNSAASGYAGGAPDTANYEMVSTGSTGHAEAVEVKFDPTKITYTELLRVFFSVAHDPTQFNRQGPDSGTQYRSAIFYTNKAQETAANAYIAQLTKAKYFSSPIVTQVNSLKAFYMAEEHHQDFARLNPKYPYIVYNDLPKVARLQTQLPQYYRAQ